MAKMVRVPDELYALMDKIRDGSGVPIGQQVKRAVEVYLGQREPETPAQRLAKRVKPTVPLVVDARQGLTPPHDPRCGCGLCQAARG